MGKSLEDVGGEKGKVTVKREGMGKVIEGRHVKQEGKKIRREKKGKKN